MLVGSFFLGSDFLTDGDAWVMRFDAAGFAGFVGDSAISDQEFSERGAFGACDSERFAGNRAFFIAVSDSFSGGAAMRLCAFLTAFGSAMYRYGDVADFR